MQKGTMGDLPSATVVLCTFALEAVPLCCIHFPTWPTHTPTLCSVSKFTLTNPTKNPQTSFGFPNRTAEMAQRLRLLSQRMQALFPAPTRQLPTVYSYTTSSGSSGTKCAHAAQAHIRTIIHSHNINRNNSKIK